MYLVILKGLITRKTRNVNLEGNRNERYKNFIVYPVF